LKFAVIVALAPTVIVQVGTAPEHPPPLQLVKTVLGPGTAVKVTEVVAR
jgi:hypothetical protein